MKSEPKFWLAKGRIPLFTFDSVHPYLRDNDFIRTGYRMDLSYTDCFVSLFHLHNESVNVWSHLLAFLAFLGLLIAHICFFALSSPSLISQKASVYDFSILSMFLLCASYTFICSALFHLCISHSKRACILFGCLDYSGISALIFGGAAASIYYILYCDSLAQRISIGLLAMANLVGVIGPFWPQWRTPQFRKGRTVIYLSSGALSLLPVAYYLSIHGTQYLPPWSNFGITGSLVMLSQYILGALIYTQRFPECIKPGFFDIWFHSHQWWHFLVVSATVTLYFSILGLMNWRLDSEKCPY